MLESYTSKFGDYNFYVLNISIDLRSVLSGDLHFLIVVKESPSTIKVSKPNSISILTTSIHASASAAKAVPTLSCRMALDAKTAPEALRATNPDPDLEAE